MADSGFQPSTFNSIKPIVGTDVTISFDTLHTEIRGLDSPDVILPWKNTNRPVVFQTGRNFENRLETYNDEIEAGRGLRKLKSAYNKNEGRKALVDYLPYSVTNFLQKLFPCVTKSRENENNAVEFEYLDGNTAWKFTPYRNISPGEYGKPPDAIFFANRLVKLKHGITAYRIIEPSSQSSARQTIVCLHGLTSSSYIWSDLCEILSSHEDGPKAKVVLFDFYGHGRSPWTGVPLSLDVLVMQTKELLDGNFYIHISCSRYSQVK
jgi:hypothetical protein